jgi:DNA-3-methyladenine glycosylase II
LSALSMSTIPRGYDIAAAAEHLGRRDRRLGRWMRRIGELEHAYSRPFDPVDALARSILYQQLSGKAAATIVGRVETLMPRRRRIGAEGLLARREEELRAAGVSRQKIAALRDLAQKSLDGIVPTTRQLARMDNEAIIEHLVQVRGIGRWTVEMLLIFRLGRADVLPVDDLGIRKGAQILHGLAEPPRAAELHEIGRRWAPYRSLASRYLWRITEFGKDEQPKVRRSQD